MLFAATLGIYRGGRGFLNNLLMAALHRTLALVQRDHVAGRVPEDLDLDVPGRIDALLKQHAIVAKRGLGLPSRCPRGFDEAIAGLQQAHALAAATR